MRTVQLLIAGCLLLAGFYLIAKRFTDAAPASGIALLGLFLVLWLGLTLANMYFGVTRAGYTLLEELPIFLLLFGLPAVAALVLKWR